MPKSNSLQAQVKIAKEAEKKFEQGHKYAEAKQYKRALECYLFAFDNGHLVNGWGGVRLSYVPSAIAQVGEEYPPAMDALRDRRDAREKLISKGETNFDVMHEWTALNYYLKDKERELAFVENLESKGRLNDELRQLVIIDNRELLLKRRNYKVLEACLSRLAWSFFSEVGDYHAEKNFPQKSDQSESHKERLSDAKKSVRENGTQCFEIALGCGRRTAAEVVLEHILSICNDSLTYSALMKAAQRTNEKRVAENLLQRAKGVLPASALQKLRAKMNDKG